jgi:hypothetical protein
MFEFFCAYMLGPIFQVSKHSDPFENQSKEKMLLAVATLSEREKSKTSSYANVEVSVDSGGFFP